MKTRRYLRKGVREVRLPYPEARTIEVVTAKGARRHEGGGAARSEAIPGLETSCDALYGAG